MYTCACSSALAGFCKSTPQVEVPKTFSRATSGSLFHSAKELWPTAACSTQPASSGAGRVIGPFFLTVGTARARSDDAVDRRKVKRQKHLYWSESNRQASRNGCESGHWPWWIEHPSECAYWKEDSQYDGEIWWNTRQQYTDEENIEYDKHWIALHGRPVCLKQLPRWLGTTRRPGCNC